MSLRAGARARDAMRPHTRRAHTAVLTRIEEGEGEIVAGFSTQPREPEAFESAMSQLSERRCTFDLQFQQGRLDMDVRAHHIPLPHAPLPPRPSASLHAPSLQQSLKE